MLKNSGIKAKFMLSVGVLLLVFAIGDTALQIKMIKDIAIEEIEEWNSIVAETIRVNMNNLMSEGKMDSRWWLFDKMREEIKGLSNVRIIRGRVDEFFAMVREKEDIPGETEKIEELKKEIRTLNEKLAKTKDAEDIEIIKEEIGESNGKIKEREAEIQRLRTIKKDEREQPKDEYDHEVLKTGKPIFIFKGDYGRTLIPYTAKAGCAGKGGQSGCHKFAKEGDVLGAISMEMSLKGINQKIRSDTIKAIIIGITRVAVILLVIYILITRIISNRVIKIKDMAEKIAGGDLTVKSLENGSSKDEISILGDAINQLKNNFVKIIGQIRNVTDKMASSSGRLSTSAFKIAGGSEEQSSKASQVAAAAEEMSATIIDVAKNTTSAVESAGDASKVAVKGGAIVEKVINNINHISSTTKETGGVIATLGDRSSEIGEIIKVIDDIADQTNLLALNAAIEAARAGEQGRGFAVVADEVRKLAERTTKATKEIGEMIKAIQDDTGRALTVMDNEVKAVEGGVNLVKDAGSALKEIVSKVEKVLDMVQHIAAAAEEQSTVADEISRDIESVAGITKETSGGTQQIARASEEIARLASELKQAVGMFKLSSS